MCAWCAAEGFLVVLQGCSKALVINPHSCSHFMVASVLWLLSHKLVYQIQGLAEVSASV